MRSQSNSPVNEKGLKVLFLSVLLFFLLLVLLIGIAGFLARILFLTLNLIPGKFLFAVLLGFLLAGFAVVMLGVRKRRGRR